MSNAAVTAAPPALAPPAEMPAAVPAAGAQPGAPVSFRRVPAGSAVRPVARVPTGSCREIRLLPAPASALRTRRAASFEVSMRARDRDRRDPSSGPPSSEFAIFPAGAVEKRPRPAHTRSSSSGSSGPRSGSARSGRMVSFGSPVTIGGSMGLPEGMEDELPGMSLPPSVDFSRASWDSRYEEEERRRPNVTSWHHGRGPVSPGQPRIQTPPNTPLRKERNQSASLPKLPYSRSRAVNGGRPPPLHATRAASNADHSDRTAYWGDKTRPWDIAPTVNGSGSKSMASFNFRSHRVHLAPTGGSKAGKARADADKARELAGDDGMEEKKRFRFLRRRLSLSSVLKKVSLS